VRTFAVMDEHPWSTGNTKSTPLAVTGRLLKAPPSRKEREKGRAPAFLCIGKPGPARLYLLPGGFTVTALAA
jgi:hypothetical protein